MVETTPMEENEWNMWVGVQVQMSRTLLYIALHTAKKLPDVPKGPSTSGNAEQKLPKYVFSGDPKHSNATSKREFNRENTGGPVAA